MSDPTKSPFDVMLEQFRQVVRQELEATVKGQPKPKLTYDTKEAAELLNLPATWVATAAREGKIPVVRIGHYVRFKHSDLETFIEMQRGKV